MNLRAYDFVSQGFVGQFSDQGIVLLPVFARCIQSQLVAPAINGISTDGAAYRWFAVWSIPASMVVANRGRVHLTAIRRVTIGSWLRVAGPLLHQSYPARAVATIYIGGSTCKVALSAPATLPSALSSALVCSDVSAYIPTKHTYAGSYFLAITLGSSSTGLSSAAL